MVRGWTVLGEEGEGQGMEEGERSN